MTTSDAHPTPSGLLLVDKPVGPTSMDVCRVVKRALRAAGPHIPKRIKVGHGGTLDPLASGLLVVLIGKATTLCDRVMAGAKCYRAEIDLTTCTTTDDREGEPVLPPSPAPSGGGAERSEAEGVRVPLYLRNPATDTEPPLRHSPSLAPPMTPPPVGPGEGGRPSLAQVEALLPRFLGTIQQRPPAFSAMKVDGQRAYNLARKGYAPDLPPRPVRIDAIRILDYAWPRLTLEIDCGKGVYVRSLARDLGLALDAGRGGHLSALRRTRIGRWSIEAATAMSALPSVLTQADLLPILPPAEL